jgi:hypothetical protein
MRIRIIEYKTGSGSALKTYAEVLRAKIKPWMAVDAHNEGMEVCRLVVADFNHFDEDPEPDPH